VNGGKIKGERTRHVLTFNPNRAEPGEEIYVNIPKLRDDFVLVLDSMNLMFNFENENTKSWFWNNLGKLLQKRLEIRISGEKIYDNSGESILEVYRDLWLHKKQKDGTMEDGIASDAIRKEVTKDDVANDDVDAIALFGMYGTKQKIKMGKILKDHGLYAPHNMANNLQYVITLPKAEEIMNAQANEKVTGYSLGNIELEYESIDSPALAKEVESLYDGQHQLSFEHVTLKKTVEWWGKDEILINETINLITSEKHESHSHALHQQNKDRQQRVRLPQHRKSQDHRGRSTQFRLQSGYSQN
jgi:hypothetical protein